MEGCLEHRAGLPASTRGELVQRLKPPANHFRERCEIRHGFEDGNGHPREALYLGQC